VATAQGIFKEAFDKGYMEGYFSKSFALLAQKGVPILPFVFDFRFTT
jgi:hypothetical protein